MAMFSWKPTGNWPRKTPEKRYEKKGVPNSEEQTQINKQTVTKFDYIHLVYY